MEVIKTEFDGVVLFKPRVFEDERGWFFESYKKDLLLDLGINTNFVQDNEAGSCNGVVRGLHYQAPPYAQAKLVRVVFGRVLDVIVDIRENSDTYGQYFSVVLDDVERLQMYVPRGFAHGYVCLSEKAIFSYKVDSPYSAISEGGIRWDDKLLNINWGISSQEAIVSAKDAQLPVFGNHIKYFAD